MPAQSKYEKYVVAHVRDAETLDQLVHELEVAGLDRAQLSVFSRDGVIDPFNQAEGAVQSPEAVQKTDDVQQARVLVTSLSATVAGLAGAGIAAAVTGGLAIPAIIAGAVAAGGVATVSEVVGVNYERDHENWIREQMNRGGVLLNIFPHTLEERKTALEVSRKFGRHAVLSNYDE